MTKFVPHAPQTNRGEVPYFEDSGELAIIGRGLKKDLAYYQNDVAAQLQRLNAGGVVFVPGEYPGEPKRYGFRVTFAVDGLPHRIDCAALPLRSETARKKDRALAQALYILARKLEATAHAYIYEPDSMPLVPYLIGEGGQTVTEALQDWQRLPLPDRTTTIMLPPVSNGGYEGVR